MHTITAILRVKKGNEHAMHEALQTVAQHVKQNEPDTVGYFISQDEADPCRFTTYERFSDLAAMERHNNSEAVARFFSVAKPIMDGELTVVTAREVSAKH